MDSNSIFSDSLGINLERLNWVNEFTLISNAYESLKLTGIDLISSNTLKKEIINLYEFTYSRAMKMMDNVDYSQSISNWEVFRELFMHRPYQMIPNDYHLLRKNQLFQNTISGRQKWKRVKVSHMKDMLEKTRDLIQLIEEEVHY